MSRALAVAALVGAFWAAGAACASLLTAGSAEKRGDLQRARREARRASPAGGAGAVLALLAAGIALGSGPSGAVWLLAWAAAALSGGASLLAGLAGKPRPTAVLATLALVAGLAAAALLAVADATRPPGPG